MTKNMPARKEIAVVHAIPVINNDSNDVLDHPPKPAPKKGQTCCGGLFDMRRAVIVVNIIGLCFGFVALLLLLTMDVAAIDDADVINAKEVSDAMDDDEAKAAFSTAANVSIGVMIFLVVSKMIFYSMGIFGAMKYNVWFVGACLAYHCLGFVVAVSIGNIFHILVTGTFVCPHIIFIEEVNAGNMSEDNDDIEEQQSCCCV